MIWDLKDVAPRDRATELLGAHLRDSAGAPHKKLPSEREMSDAWGINRVTLRCAIRRLCDDGLLYVVPGSGIYVGNMPIELNLKRTSGFSSSVKAAGREPGSYMLESPVFDDEADVPEIARGSEGERPFMLRRVRTIDGVPSAVEETYLSPLRFPGIDEQDFATTSLYTWLAEAHGTEAAHEDARIALIEVPAAAASALGVEAGSPAFSRQGIVWDEQGGAIESYRTIMLPRDVVYASGLRRSAADPQTRGAKEHVPAASTYALAPKYIQLREAVRASIESGDYPIGFAIPTEAELAQMYGVNRLTVRSGLDMLVEEGLLERVRGKGVYVRMPRSKANLNEIGGFRLNGRSSAGQRTARRILGRYRREAGPWYAGVFECDERDELFFTRGLSRGEGDTASLEETYVPQEVAPEFDTYDAALFDADEILAYCGVEVTSAVEHLGIVKLERGDARVLGVEEGSAALRLICVERDAQGRVVEVATSLTVGAGAEFLTAY